MLQKETVSKFTLECLSTLMNDVCLSDFFLVGGTALALQIGHRISIDLDLFSMIPFDENALLEHMESKYGFILNYQSKNTLKGRIDELKIDLITHAHPLIHPILVYEGVRMANLADIAAMKLNAIAGNGTRLKDFIDIAYLSAQLTLGQMTSAYEEKYTTRNPVIILKALAYHDDINFNEPIEMLGGNYSWQQIKERLNWMMHNPEKLSQKAVQAMKTPNIIKPPKLRR